MFRGFPSLAGDKLKPTASLDTTPQSSAHNHTIRFINSEFQNDFTGQGAGTVNGVFLLQTMRRGGLG